MSSNIGPEAKSKYNEYLNAKQIDEKIKLLEEFISLVPKHKGTEKIVALNRSKLAKLKREKKKKKELKKRLSAGLEDPFAIQREKDYLQMLLVSDHFGEEMGAGKSTLLENLTGISDIKTGVFTPVPKIGIYEWNKIKYQLIEMPALHEWSKLSRELSAIRTTDTVLLVIDLTRDPIQQMKNILNMMERHNIYLNYKKPKVKLKKTGSDGIKIFFRTKEAEESRDKEKFIEEMIKENGIKNAIVKIYENMSIKQIEMAFNRSSAFVPAMIIATKADRANTKKRFLKLKQFYSKEQGHNFSIHPVAISWNDKGEKYRQGLEDLGLRVLEELDLIRIYTKSKHGIANRPLVINRGATIGEVAQKIHKDLYEYFRFANVFRHEDSKENEKEENYINNIPKEEGRRKYRVGLDFEVEEFDIVEIISDI